MKIATYNILKGGSKRVHWSKMIDGHQVDVLCVQESYAHDIHLPPLLYPEHQSRSIVSRAGPNTWGSGIYSGTGSIRHIEVPTFEGWVVGAELIGASWQADREGVFVFSLHAPGGPGGYSRQVNLILDEIAKIVNGREVIIAGDFNVSVSHWVGSKRKTGRQDLAIQSRLAKEFGLINCWQMANPDREPEQTLRWTGDRTIPYHCDAIFVPERWREKLRHCAILVGQEWEELSDHNPIVAEFLSA